MRQKDSQQTAVSFHPYGIDAEDDFTPTLSASGGPHCSTRHCAPVTPDDCLFVGGDHDGVARAEPLSHPWWRPHVNWPAPVSDFFPLVRYAPSPRVRGGLATSLREPDDAGGDADSCHQYYNPGDGAVRQPWASCRSGPAAGGQAGVAWYQLAYDTPAPPSTAQPYNIAGGADAAAATFFRSPERRGCGVSSCDVHGPRGDPAGVRGDLLGLRQRPDALDVTCRDNSPSRGKVGAEIRSSQTSSLLLQRSVDENGVTPPPSPASSSLRPETATRLGGVGKTEFSRTPTTGRVPDWQSSRHVPLRENGVTLERLMNAVRRARSRARETQEGQTNTDCSLGVDIPGSTVTHLGQGNSPKRVAFLP